MSGMSDDEWARMTGSTSRKSVPKDKPKPKPAASTPKAGTKGSVRKRIKSRMDRINEITSNGTTPDRIKRV